MTSIGFDRTNAICGAIFMGLGACFAYQAYGLDLGTALRMGPGYFPLVLAVVLFFLGLVIVLQAMRVKGEPVGPMALRGMLFILPAPVFFGLTVRDLGFVPSLFVTVLIAAYASHRMTTVMALLSAIGITIFSVAVFTYGLGLPFERFGPWLRF